MKNRFCRRTKLSEPEFIHIVVAFSSGMTAVQACAFIKTQDCKVSRQTVENKFLELGNYLYRKLTRPASLRTMRETNPGIDISDDEIEREALQAVWDRLRGTLDYASYREGEFVYPGPDRLIETLQERWRRFNGFQKGKLKSHVGFAAYHSQPVFHASVERMSGHLLMMLMEDPL